MHDPPPPGRRFGQFVVEGPEGYCVGGERVSFAGTVRPEADLRRPRALSSPICASPSPVGERRRQERPRASVTVDRCPGVRRGHLHAGSGRAKFVSAT